MAVSIDYTLIGKRIKQRRQEMKMTQEQMSERLQVSVGYVSQIERGISKPNLEMLSNISGILNCDVSNFISNATLEKDNFLNKELSEMVSGMSFHQKQMIIEIAEIIKKYR